MNNVEHPIVTIDTSEYKKSFETFISNDANKRILFSGRFGSGKTTFLNDFFKESEYEVFYLTPVKYTIASNEDIMQLIYVDIISQLLPNVKEILDAEKDVTKFSFWERLSWFLATDKAFAKFISELFKLGKRSAFILKMMEPISDMHERFEKMPKDISPLESLKNYKKLALEKVNIDIDTDFAKREFISEVVTSLYEDRRPVLLIDDIDRIDPEHIFRLFNIFSTTFGDDSSDFEDDSNNLSTLGFHKIIFVCDIDNVRSIFHHKYGMATDFCGYIDKFYSTIPYNFDITQYAITEIYQYLNNWFENNEEMLSIATNTCRLLYQYGYISLRTMVSFGRFSYFDMNNKNTNSINKQIGQDNWRSVFLFDFLDYLYAIDHDILEKMKNDSTEVKDGERVNFIRSMVQFSLLFFSNFRVDDVSSNNDTYYVKNAFKIISKPKKDVRIFVNDKETKEYPIFMILGYALEAFRIEKQNAPYL